MQHADGLIVATVRCFVAPLIFAVALLRNLLIGGLGLRVGFVFDSFKAFAELDEFVRSMLHNVEALNDCLLLPRGRHGELKNVHEFVLWD